MGIFDRFRARKGEVVVAPITRDAPPRPLREFVYLDDLFHQMAPSLVDDINAASLTPFRDAASGHKVNTNELKLAHALKLYANLLQAEAGQQLTGDQVDELDRMTALLMSRAATAEGHRSAFTLVRETIAAMLSLTSNADDDGVA